MEVTQPPIVHLELESRPESVAVVRAMLAGASEQLDFGAELLADLKTAISEVCNNVVMHAYGEDFGPLIVHLVAERDALFVSVRDCGRGMSEEPPDEDHVGVGVAVVNALAAHVEFLSSPGQGTDVRMLFAYRRSQAPSLNLISVSESAVATAFPLDGDVVVNVTPVPLLASILGRIAGAVAAEAFFSIDRYSDLYLITDDLAAHARSFAAGHAISAGLEVELHRLSLRVGPFRSGTAARLQVNEAGNRAFMLELLVDHVEVEAIEDGAEAVHVVLVDPHEEAAGRS